MGIADTVVITNSTPPVDEAAHNAAMIAKVDGAAAVPEGGAPADPAPAPAGDRPAWLPEKFASAEDMAKAYAELETKQGSGKPADPPAPAPELNADGTPKVPEVDPAAAALADKGLDLAEFSKEFSTAGALAPDSYAKLEAAGYPKAVVDQYIAGQQALAVQYEADVKSAAGDADFNEVASWAAANLSEPEKVAYNKAIDSGDINQAKLAVAGITQKYTAANPSEGNLLAGRTSNVAGDSYESIAQMKADMSDPKYKTDPAFRKKVADKIGRSDIL